MSSSHFFAACLLAIHLLTRATPYALVYSMEVVLTIEVEISSLRILMETKLEEAE